jgi:hypothetical protein
MGVAAEAGSALPLSAAERTVADRCARRAHAELRTLLMMLPPDARSAAGVARLLSLDRTTCHRIVASLAETNPGADLLVRLPGVRGLRRFIGAARLHGGGEGEVAAADAAVDGLDQVVRELAGSQLNLARRLRAGSAPKTLEPDRMRSVGERLFQAGVDLTGRWSETALLVQVYRPLPDDAKKIDRVTISGYIGHHARPDALPLVVTQKAMTFADPQRPEDFQTLDHHTWRGRLDGAVLEQFSTHPVPVVTARGPRGAMVQTIDPAIAGASGPVDVVIARRSDTPGLHPAHDDPPVQEVWYSKRFPARRLLFDVYLHRSLARACIPALSLHLFPPDMLGPPSERWLTRHPRGPRLAVLGSDLENSATPAYPRYAELMRSVFRTLEWPEEEFVGYRCETEYPLWNAVYIMTFDFGPQDG